MGGVGTIWRGDEGNVPKQSDGNYQNTDRNIHGIGETWDALREKYVERDSVRDNRSSSTHCFNNEVGLAMPVKHTYRPLTMSDVGQQTRVSFATIPILCGHPDDRFVEHADSSIKRHFKPTSEHQPTPGRRMPISDSLGKGRPLNDHSTVSMQPNNLSSNSTSSEANCISLTESNTPFMMQTDSLSATPASALNTIRMKRDAFEYKVSAIPRRLIDFSRAGELASSTPQKHTDKIRSDELRHGANWSVVQAACPLESLDSGDGNKTNLSIQKHPTHSCAFRYHEQPIEHRANAANDIHRTRFGEEIVTQSPEVKKQATDVLNSILQQRVTNSPGLFNRSGTSLYSPCGRCAENHASVLGCGGYCTYRQKSAELGQRREKALAPKVSEVVGNIERSETSALSSKRPPTKSAEWEGCGNEREVIGHTTSLMPSGHSTIRARVPRGQTRRLASMFETMTEEAIAEMTSERSRLQANVSHRRNKSVPAQRGTHEGYAQRDPSASLLKGSLDDSFLMERECDNQEGKRYISRAIFRLSSSNVGSTKDNLVHIHNPKPIFSETQCMMAPINRGTNSMDNRSDDLTTANHVSGSVVSSLSQLPSATVPRIESTTQCFSTSLKGTHHSVGRHEMTGEAGRKPTEAGGYAGLAQKKAYFYANNGQQLQSGERKPGRNYGMECLRVGDELDNNDEHARIHANIVHSGTVPPFQSDCNNESHRKVSEHGSDDWCAGYMATDAIERSYDAADNIAEVNKAFSFVDKEESMVDDTDARYSRGGAAVHPVPKQPLGYSGREHRQSPADDVPVRFSPATCNMPVSAGERVATYEWKDTGKVVQSKRDSITRFPLATSTPLEGSPASMLHSVRESPARLLDSSAISTITVSTVNGNNAEQNHAAQIKRLSEGILVQEERLSQAVAALAHAKKFSTINGTLAELCAHRELLLCRERHASLHRELERVKMLHVIKKKLPDLSGTMQGSYEVSSIIVYLNRNFCIRNLDEGNSYAFVALLKAAEQVYATEAITLMDTRVMRVSSVKFIEHIRFASLPPDMIITLEIYALKVSEARAKGVEDRSCAKLRNKARSLLSPLRKPNVDESVVSSSEFTLCGNVVLNRETVGTQRFYLNNVVYPLEGTIEIRSACSALPPIIETDFQGFLTMYEVVSGFGSWARYWAVLRRAVVHFWKYPDDEAANRPALAYMDLTKCTDRKIKPAAFEVCSRPHAFSVDLLIPTSSSVVEKKRVLLSADTKDQCVAWIDAINETLDILRG